MRGPSTVAERSRHMRQRGDIQGLRAVAVLTVVAAHAGLGLEGGYVGVDVFFVISGFLISQQLFREAAANGRVSLASFYARRARRILPAATVVLLVTLLASAALLSRLQAREVGIDALWASLFAANFRFTAVEMDYFAQDQATSPLQHYWSLAVEEQFYVVWPLLLLVAIGIGMRKYGFVSVRHVGPMLIALTSASLAWSFWLTSQGSATAYFSSFARAWELGVGALVALYGPRLMRRADDDLRNLLCLTGLGAIAVACLEFTSLTLVPGWPALLPVLGSAMIVLSGVRFERDGTQTRPGVALRLLSTRPMRWVGDRSYSLYLWHWPVLVLPTLYLERSLPLAADVALAGLAVVLAALTYAYVENPLRRPRQGWTVRWARLRSIAFYPATVGLVAAASWGTVTWVEHELTPAGNNPAVTLVEYASEGAGSEDADSEDADSEDGAEGESGAGAEGATQSAGSAEQTEDAEETVAELSPAEERTALVRASVLAARDGRGVPSDLSPDLLSVSDDVADVSDCDYYAGTRDLCPRGDADADRTMVTIGDSHGRMWLPALDAFAEEEGWKVYHLVRAQCPPADVPMPYWAEEDAEACTEFNSWAQRQVAELDPDLVVVASLPPRSPGALSADSAREANETVRASYQSLMKDLAKHSRHQVMLGHVPYLQEHPIECLTGGGDVDLGSCLLDGDPEVTAIQRAMEVGAARGGASVVDTQKWVCWDGDCPSVVGATVTYRDTNHLTTSYVEELAPLVVHELRAVVGGDE